MTGRPPQLPSHTVRAPNRQAPPCLSLLSALPQGAALTNFLPPQSPGTVQPPPVDPTTCASGVDAYGQGWDSSNIGAVEDPFNVSPFTPFSIQAGANWYSQARARRRGGGVRVGTVHPASTRRGSSCGLAAGFCIQLAECQWDTLARRSLPQSFEPWALPVPSVTDDPHAPSLPCPVR